MNTGFAKSISLSDNLVSGDVKIEMEWGNGAYVYDYLSRKQAVELINHLKKVFELEEEASIVQEQLDRLTMFVGCHIKKWEDYRELEPSLQVLKRGLVK